MNAAIACRRAVGVSGVLAVSFIVLKLSGAIAWPWMIVLAPLWIPYALALMGVTLALAWAVLS
jgi:hypothetical protein